MRALITGAGGFAGRHLAKHLAEVTDWELWGNARPHPEGPVSAGRHGLRIAQADLTDWEATRSLLADLRPDYIFHLAAQSIVQEALRDPQATLMNNIVGELNVLRAMHELELPARVLLVGSGEEYGRVCPEDLPVDEDTPFRPDNPYAVSKIAQDMLGLQYWLAYKLPIIRVRPFNHIGPGQSDDFVTAAFARQVAAIEAGRQEPVLRVGNLNAERDFTDVRDMVRAYHLAMTQGEPGEVYNIGSGTPTAISDILAAFLSMSSADVRVERDPARLRPSDVPRIVCDPARFHERTGWLPEIGLEESLADILNDWRNRVSG
ncbi:MAG: GDP-mannose 4,6-dehydratase [Chloroflexia bacterium]